MSTLLPKDVQLADYIIYKARIHNYPLDNLKLQNTTLVLNVLYRQTHFHNLFENPYHKGPYGGTNEELYAEYHQYGGDNIPLHVNHLVNLSITTPNLQWEQTDITKIEQKYRDFIDQYVYQIIKLTRFASAHAILDIPYIQQLTFQENIKMWPLMRYLSVPEHQFWK